MELQREPQRKNYAQANKGRRFESMIESANRHYRAADMAIIEKTHVKMKRIQGKWVHAEKAPPDFMGAVGARFICFDTKETAAASLPIKMITERLHQLTYLQQVDRMGGIAFYLVHFTKTDRYFILTPQQAAEAVERAQAGGRKSIQQQEFLQEVGSSLHLHLDYLEPWRGKHEI